jgi:cell division protein FtsN
MTMTEHVFTDDFANRAGARNRVISRVVLVVGLIVALFAGLLIFEHKGTEQDVAITENSTASLASPRIGVSVSASSLSAGGIPEELKQAIRDAPDSAQLALASMSAPTSAIPVTNAPPSIPEGSSDVVIKPSPQNIAPPTARVLRETASEHSKAESSRATATTSNPSVAWPAPPLRDQGGFLLQLGVFSNAGNAEELKGRLKLAGIPAQLETRVQVGPFSSREEALKAQEKLKKLGLGGGMLVPAIAKRP